MVREVAAMTDAAIPDFIVIGLNEGFFVTEPPVQLTSGKALPAKRVLHLPAPYLMFMMRVT